MIKDPDYNQDNKTILVDRQGRAPASSALTDFAAPERFEELEKRMIFAARLPSASAFNASLNALVAAASELLSEVVQLRRNEVRPNLADLNEHLTKALHLFDDRALHGGAERSEVSVARYLLCTVLDEAVVTSLGEEESAWSQMSLLSAFHRETSGGERFFQLLENMSKDPVRHLPMMELAYLCLSLGFEGKYRIQARGSVELESIRDALYRQIRHLRGDVPRELSPHWQGTKKRRPGLVRIVPVWMVALFTVVCLVVMYSGFAWVLGEHRDTVLQPYQSFESAAVLPQPPL